MALKYVFRNHKIHPESLNWSEKLSIIYCKYFVFVFVFVNATETDGAIKYSPTRWNQWDIKSKKD